MTWKLTPYGQTRTGLPGVPWRDLTAEEFAAAEKLHPGIRERGYFEREPSAVIDTATAAADEIIGGRMSRTKKAGG